MLKQVMDFDRKLFFQNVFTNIQIFITYYISKATVLKKVI